MEVANALTFISMLICILLAFLFAIFKLPEISILFLIGIYYFLIFHIGQVVGDSYGWYRNILTTYFLVVTITVIIFAVIYYRYGLLHNGKYTDISILDSIYFSISTFTTLVYGDFAPISRIRHIASVEALFGYIGLGLWISLISNFINNIVEDRKSVRKHNSKLLFKLDKNKKMFNKTLEDE